jgi:hypothetical protein
VFLVALAILGGDRATRAEEAPVPVQRQADLLVRLAAYDRNLAARSAGRVRITIVTNPADPDSRAVAAAMESALQRFATIGGLPKEIASVPFPGGPELAASCKANHVSVVYLAPGLDASVPGLVHELDGVDVLTATAIPRFVEQGVVLGFDLVSGKPTLLFNLSQAKRQNVAMDPQVIQLMKVVR